jgi:hypothetical protein
MELYRGYEIFAQVRERGLRMLYAQVAQADGEDITTSCCRGVRRHSAARAIVNGR